MPRLPQPQFEQLVHEHHAAVYRAALRVHGEPADAADTAQEVFLRVLSGKADLQHADGVRATLCWLAAMLANNAVRSRRRRRHHEENAMTITTEPIENPAQLCEDRDLHRTVQQLVHELPGELRMPLQLRCADGLSFAAIGGALAVPESTVHERVQRALQRLRQALARRGFAIAAAGVPDLLAALPQPASPLGLQARLLALGQTGAVATAGLVRRMVFAGLGVGAAVVLVVAAQRRGGSAELPGVVEAAPSVAAVPVAEQDPAPVRSAVPAVAPAIQDPAPPPPPKVATASVLHGTVHDAGAWPVGGARVVAVAAGGLKPFELAHTTTDAHGAFRFELGADGTAGLKPSVARLRVIEEGRKLLETADLTLPRAATAEPLQLTLPAEVGTAMSRYQLAVEVRASDGGPLADVPVTLQPVGEPGSRPGQVQAETESRTGADGVALFGGRTLGTKWLFVDGRGVGRCASFTQLPLARAGEHRTKIELPPGQNLAGRFTTLDGTPIEWANIWLEDETSGLRHPTRLGADGSVTFDGLSTGPYTLRVYSQHWSTVEKRGLRAGGPAFAIQLKRQDDARDVGDHMAELHGGLVDAATGGKLDFGDHQVSVFARRDGESTLLLDAVEPPRPVQTMSSDTRHEQFHLGGLGAGRWVVVASIAGYAKGTAEFTLRDGEVRTDLVLALERGAQLRGICVDAEGRPVARANVFVVGVGALPDRALEGWRAWGRADQDVAAPMPSMLACSAVTGADGSFVLDRVPPGVAVRLVARQKGRDLVVEAGRAFRSGEQVEGLRLQFPAR